MSNWSYNQGFQKESFGAILGDFQKAVKHKEYSKRIDYEIWKKLKQATIVLVAFADDEVKFFDHFNRLMYSSSISEKGFGRFFYDKYIKKEETKMEYTATVANTATINRNGSILNTTADTISLDAEQLKSNYYYPTTGTSPVINTGDAKTWGTIAIQSDAEELRNRVRKLENDMLNKVDKEKENKTMNGLNFDFGPCGNGVRLSMYGMAIQNNAGEWVSYNPATKEIINVDILNIADGGKYMYKIPVPIQDVKSGDIVVHNRVPMFVTEASGDGNFTVVDVRAGESKTIIPARNMFGFNFMTKVVNLFGNIMGTPSADQPFGNMLPFLMLGNEDNSNSNDAMLMLMLAQNQTQNLAGGNLFSNPMMMYFLMKDNKNFDPMMLLLMNQMPAAPTPTEQ